MSEEYDFEISDAVRSAAPMAVALIGQTGTGKTYSGLMLARGLVGPEGIIGVIDTEGGRSLVYADDPEVGGFKHMPFEAPYPPEKFSAALKKAVNAGWQAAIVDTASLEHDGEGGLLDMADQEAERLEAVAAERGNVNRAISQQKWTQPKLRHKRFLNYATGLPMHIIFCFRETLTTDFTLDKPTSVLTPVMEKNTAFSFGAHAVIDQSHNAQWTRIEKPFIGCIEDGKPISVAMGQNIQAVLAGASWERVLQLFDENEISGDRLTEFVKAIWKMPKDESLPLAKIKAWGPIHHQRIIKVLEKRLETQSASAGNPAAEEKSGSPSAPDESAQQPEDQQASEGEPEDWQQHEGEPDIEF